MKKIEAGPGIYYRLLSLKLFRMMKLTMLLLTVACLQVSAHTYSQEKITLKMQTAEIKKVLAAIEKKSEYRFLFNEDVVKGKPLVSIDVQKADINEVLTRVFSNTGIAYRILHTNLVVLKETDSPADIAASVLTVSGKVTSVSGESLAGVSVTVKGSSVGTTTDVNGNYSLVVPDDAVLVFSYIGYAAVEEPVSGRTTVNIVLQTAERTMDEVVVVGYGTLRRSQVVGSVAKVSGADIARQPVLSAAQGLQGKASGIQVIASGAPGSQPQVRIRGTNTITGNPNPVYVVDGVITDDIRNINLSDIESVEVLKDAASQAIYGSRGSNGVILITTKSGKGGKLKIGLDSYVGFRAVTSKVKMADARTYAAYSNEARSYDNQVPLFDLDTLQYNTDWFDEITRNGMVQNHVVNLSGGTDRTTYYFSAGLFKDEGIVHGHDYTRGVFRINNEYRLADFLKLGHNLNLSIAHSNNKPSGDAFNAAYRQAPTTPVKFPNGNYGYLSALSVGNPVASLEYTNNISDGVRLLGNIYGEITPVKGLVLRTSMNFDRYNNSSRAYTPKYFIWSGQQNDSSVLNISRGQGFYYIFDNSATYRNIFASDHEVSAMVGYSAERDRSSSFSGTGRGVPAEENLWYLDQSNPNSRTLSNSGSITRRASVYGRLTYSFLNKYNLNGVLRRDGSSNFPVNQKWGTFYSAGASWIVSREGFMQNQKIFDELKLRAGYGKIGNDRIARGSALNPVTNINNAYSFGGDVYPIVSGITFNQITNATFSWETTEGIDAGFEFTALNRKLTGEIAYYNKLTKAYIPVTLAAAFGDADNSVISQAADVRNKGVEFNFGWKDDIGKSFSYRIGFNVTFNTNNVERVDGNLLLRGGSLGNGQIVTYTVVDQPIGSFWVYETAGIFRDSATLLATPRLTGTRLGDLIFVDQDKDGVINEKDRVFAGSYQPKTYYGISGGITWRALDFSFDCYGNAGNKVYNGKKAIRLGNDNIEAARAENRWSPTNGNGTQPRASNAIPAPSDFYVESGNFFRINNITLGYTFPSSGWNVGISGLRVFASAQNPAIFKKFSGYTPELPAESAINSGIELGIYPITSTYMVGVNVSF